MKKRSLFIAALSVAIVGGEARAQNPVRLPEVVIRAEPGPRALAGIVRDTAGFTVDGVEISIHQLQRRAWSRPDGSFRFDSLPKGTYEVRARKIGYGPQVREIKVDSLGGIGDFELLPMPRALPPMTTTSTRLGLSGVVADTSFMTLPGAFVRVMGEDMYTTTDSAGTFFMPARTGSHLVAITKEGFRDRLVSVTIPEDSGRKVIAYLQPMSGPTSVREAWNLPDLGARLAWRKQSSSLVFTHEDLEKLGIEWAYQAVRMSTSRFFLSEVPDAACAAVVDGGPKTAKLSTLTIDDVESIEIYAGGHRASEIAGDQTTGVRVGPVGATKGRSASTMHDNTQYAAEANQGKICPTVYVWMRAP